MSNIGHNRPDQTPNIIDQLQTDYSSYLDEVLAYEVKVGELPGVIHTKEDHDRITDVIVAMRLTYRNVEATRVAEKDPFLKATRAVDGFFDPIKVELEKLTASLNKTVTTYLRAKEQEERRRREEIAAAERQKALELRKAEAERVRRAEEAKRAETKAKHESVAAILANEAEHQEAVAVAAEKDAEDKPAELARTRAEAGQLSTLQSYWTFEVEDWDKVDLEAIRSHLKRDAIEAAIKSCIKVGIREIEGVRIFQTSKLQVR